MSYRHSESLDYQTVMFPLEKLLLMCTSCLPGLSYLEGSKILIGNFYLYWKLYLLCRINESWQVTCLDCCRNNYWHLNRRCRLVLTLCFSIHVCIHACPYIQRKNCQSMLQLEMLREQLNWYDTARTTS